MKKAVANMKSSKNVLTDDIKYKVINLYYKHCEIRYKIRYLKHKMISEGGDNFTLENKIKTLEYHFLEIDKILLQHEVRPSSKKPQESKDGHSHKDHEKNTIGGSLTKPANKYKNSYLADVLKTPREQKPTFRYILSGEEMLNLISKTTALNKKNKEKLDEFSLRVFNMDL
mmetsp:Transcript_19678/g.17393  ORF Transcript_19678/g.17393 Transcript_19678/m.17393 type:complete len:171 (+) Transcript_19678:495-1007(+)